MSTKTVMLVGRGEKHLTEGERDAVKAKLGEKVVFVRCDPATPGEHAANCDRVNPDMVLLPPHEPIYVAAIRKGVVHATHRPYDDQLLQITGIEYHLRHFLVYFPSRFAYWNK